MNNNKRFRITAREWTGDIEIKIDTSHGKNETRVCWTSANCTHLSGLNISQVKKMCLTNGWGLEVLSTLTGKERQLTSATNASVENQ